MFINKNVMIEQIIITGAHWLLLQEQFADTHVASTLFVFTLVNRVYTTPARLLTILYQNKKEGASVHRHYFISILKYLRK